MKRTSGRPPQTDKVQGRSDVQYFDDIQLRQRIELGSYTFTAERILSFARRYDPQPFHLDEEAGRKSVFGGLAASGWHTASAWMKTMIDHRERQIAAARARGEEVVTAGPSPGFKDLKWLKPVLVDDTVTYFTEAISKRASASRPQWGLVFSLGTGVNQHGDLVFSFEGSAFLPVRGLA